MTDSPDLADRSVTLVLDGLKATETLAASVALRSRAKDVIALSGDLGAGKTSFARAFLRARPGGAGIAEIPSPTFTLVQVYDLDPPIWHLDLYRLVRADDVWELGFEEALVDAIALIEWPERMGSLLPRERLDIALSQGEVPEQRRAIVTGRGNWAKRLTGLAT